MKTGILSYLDLSREMKKAVENERDDYTVVIGTLYTFIKGLVQGPKDLEITRRVETVQTTALPEYWEESWRLEETCCH